MQSLIARLDSSRSDAAALTPHDSDEDVRECFEVIIAPQTGLFSANDETLMQALLDACRLCEPRETLPTEAGQAEQILQNMLILTLVESAHVRMSVNAAATKLPICGLALHSGIEQHEQQRV
jgi:hypothetical protein